MKTLFEKETIDEIIGRIGSLSPRATACGERWTSHR